MSRSSSAGYQPLAGDCRAVGGVDGRGAHKGKVGTGFDEETMRDLAKRFKPLATMSASLARVPRELSGANWLKPELVAEVRYAELTADGVVRHASFLGLREDKPAAEVVPEAEASMPVLPDKPASFPITHADRRIFGEPGPTKGQLAAWYEAVAPRALEWMGGRPLSLVRCPQGVEGGCFFQKHLKEGWGDELEPIAIRESDGEVEQYFVANSAEGLLRCVQMGTIEFHGWGARASDVEHPDRLVFDLDPDTKLDFAAIRAAAMQLRDSLGDMGLATFPMLTGGKGIHVIAPLDASRPWQEVEDFAHRFAMACEQLEPSRYTASMSKARRKGRIFIDWLRNQRGSTAVLPWSVRARPGAGVATPVSWDELADLPGADAFSLTEPEVLLERAKTFDPAWGRAQQVLPAR